MIARKRRRLWSPEGMDPATHERRKKEFEAALAPFAHQAMTPELAAETRALMRPTEERRRLEATDLGEMHGNT
jgi:cytochrome P450